MSSETMFLTNQPITVNWRSPGGESFSQRALLHNVSKSTLSVSFIYGGTYGPMPPGTNVRVEAPDANGAWLAQFAGRVARTRGRMTEIALDGAMEVVQRRAHPRARLPFSFTSAIVLSRDPVRYFLAHPVDISAGGVRLLHRVPLRVEDRFRLNLRPRDGVTVSPIGRVLETVPTENSAEGPGPVTYMTRSCFEDLGSSYQRFLFRYVGTLLQQQPPTAR